MRLNRLRASAPHPIRRPLARLVFGLRNAHAATVGSMAETTEDTTETGEAHDLGHIHVRHRRQDPGPALVHRLDGALEARKSPRHHQNLHNYTTNHP